MKKSTLLIILLSLELPFYLFSQVTEVRSIADFPAGGRTGTVSFVLGDTAYVGLGLSGVNGSVTHNDFYKYDYVNDEWSQIADYPEYAGSYVNAFTIDGKAYVGAQGSAGFYEYDPQTGSWRILADFPSVRQSASSFAIGDKGYVGLGKNGSTVFGDFYEYDPTTDQWREIAGISTNKKRHRAAGFSVKGKGYIVGGTMGYEWYSDILSYDPELDIWTEVNFTETEYIGNVHPSTVYVDRDGLAHGVRGYDKVTIDVSENSVTISDSPLDLVRIMPVAFYLNSSAYFGMGLNLENSEEDFRSDFIKFYSVNPPSAVKAINDIDEKSEFTKVTWENKEPDFEDNIIYLSIGDSVNYKEIATVAATENSYRIENTQMELNTIHFVKVAALSNGIKAYSTYESFYPIFRDNKINTPTIISLTSDQMLDNSELKLINYDKAEEVILERSVNENDFQVIDTLGTARGNADTTSFYFTNNFIGNINSVSFRIRLFDNSGNRPTSNFSDQVELDLGNEPIIESISLSKIDVKSNSFQIDINVDKLINVEKVFIESKEINDQDFSRVEVDPNSISMKSIRELDSLVVRLIAMNASGEDTSNLIYPNTILFAPSKVKPVYSSINSLGFKFEDNSTQKSGTIVERSIFSEEFNVYDTIPTDQKEYVDTNVESGKTYLYRLFNYKDGVISSKSDSISIKAQNMGSWKKFNGDGLSNELDSISKYSMDYKFVENGEVFFLSTKYQKLYKFDLDSKELIKLNDFPSTHVKSINSPIMHNGIIYCFGATDEAENQMSTVFRFNKDKNKWNGNLKIPFEGNSIEYSKLVEDKVHLIMSTASGKYSIGYYSITDQVWFKTDYSLDNVSPALVANSEGNLIIYDTNNGKISYNLISHDISLEGKFDDEISSIQEQSLVNYNNQLLHFNIQTNSIEIIDFEQPKISSKKEVLPDFQDSIGYAFEYNGKLFYGLAINTKEEFSLADSYYDMGLLYYRDENAPLKPTQFQIDSLGIAEARFSWTDSPNEDAYCIEIINNDNLILIDTLNKNQVQYKVQDLIDGGMYTVQLKALRGEYHSEETLLKFVLDRVAPYSPTNFKAKALSSSEILYTWNPIETSEIPLDSLIFEDLNGLKYTLSVDDTSFLYAGLDENTRPNVYLSAKNEYGVRGVGEKELAITYLNSPVIKKLEVHQSTSYFDLIFEDKSSEENYYSIYRKSSEDTSFVKLDSISTTEYTIYEEALNYEDKTADLSTLYEYYIVAEYQEVNETSDTTIYYRHTSLPSETFSTENAVLSVNPYLDANISVYPNPADQEVFIQVENHVIIKRIEVLNVNGSLVKGFKMNASYNISDLKDGLYFIKIYTDQGDTTKKLIKR